MTYPHALHELSLRPGTIHTAGLERYAAATRTWQGIPGIERTREGAWFATWYSGGAGEGADNYVVLGRSADGVAWEDPVLVVDPPGAVRAFDPVVWIDPLARLWLFWAQSYAWWNGRGGVFAIRCDEPDAAELRWTAARRIAEGVMMNKPLVRSNQEWLLPTAVWGRVAPSETPPPKPAPGSLPELAQVARSNVTVSTDRGETFHHRGGADVPLRSFDEHMIAELGGGRLWMLVRTDYGVGQATSEDGGITWSPGRPTEIGGPSSRFHLRRLSSGRLLLVANAGVAGGPRSHLTASLSDDDGATWPHVLLLDERVNVSYPDVAVHRDSIAIIYDRDRTGVGEILLKLIDEDAILAGSEGQPQDPIVVSRLTGRRGAGSDGYPSGGGPSC